MKELVSVVIPAYNCEKYIRECIESALSQSYENIEVIVVNDCSTDSTYQILKSYSDERITVINNSKNLGVVKSRNKAIESSEGRYIAFLDADDIWKKDKLKLQIEQMRNNSSAISCCTYKKISDDGSEVGSVIVPKSIKKDTLLKGNVMGCSTVVYDVKLLGKRYFQDYELSEDFVLWYSILSEGHFCLGVIEPLVKYRVLDASRSSDKIKVVAYQWYLYRNVFKLSLPSAVFYYFIYLIKGYLRYKG